MTGNGARKYVHEIIVEEKGFTLIEAMIALVLMVVGLLAVANVFPQGLTLTVNGKDQTTATSLALQEIEDLKSQPTSSLVAKVGDYATNVLTAYFDQDGHAATQAYFSRDVQIQYWKWDGTQFVIATPPYTVPSEPFVYRVSVATHWLVKGQTSFQAGQSVNGCVVNATAVPIGPACVQVTTFITP